MIEAIGFDLGNTLVEYGHPLSWHNLYREALIATAAACRCSITENDVLAGETILTHYNTRLNPRSEEFDSETILGKILRNWNVPLDGNIRVATQAFFSFFRRDCAPYKDTIPALRALRSAGLRIGILTDVPYGMPSEFSTLDIASFEGMIDILLTSVDIGYRKPTAAGYRELARELRAEPEKMVFVGDEPKDIEGAKAVGMKAVFVDRTGSGKSLGEDARINSLLELVDMLAGVLPPEDKPSDHPRSSDETAV